MTLLAGRPESGEGREAREMRTYDLLDRLGIAYTRVDHAPAETMEDCVAIDEALRCKAEGRADTILFGLTGTGYFDMAAYQKFNDGAMSDSIPTDAELEASFEALPKLCL